jgi:sialate O-acetylesterase
VASAETLNDFSATAWFFAKALFEKHRTPIGLINVAWGGTPVEAWMSRDALAAFPEKIACGEQYANTALCEEIVSKNGAAIKVWDDQLSANDTGSTQGLRESDLWGRLGDGTITLPGDFSQTGIENFCGSIWLHREFTLDDTVDRAKLWLGTIVDADTVFINGVEVGNTGYRYPPRKYTVPTGLLRKGKNHIVIRVVCNDGQGGVTIDKDFKIFTNNICINLGGVWQYRIGMQMPGPRPDEFFFQRQPMGLFNTMIAPMLDYPCKGIIWYQGESNDPNPHEYSALFTAFINDWRNKMRLSTSHYEDMSSEDSVTPFLFVQLPIFGEPKENCESDSWAIIREAQASALSLPATGMAAGLDLGEWNDLHPMNKKDIGRRLALVAEKVVNNAANTSPGPLLRDYRLREGKLLLNFDNCGTGLVAQTQPYVSVIAEGKIFRLPADIAGTNCLSVDISGVKNPEKILYAWANNPRDRSLYNTDGLPMIPFRFLITDYQK